ncbi:Uncharacterized membrane protein [Desulfomicrobium norvegicum]|uniref:Uncharacterized membrane protein n=1 Tax=Desulfomicrobium norvegicum (strain DSM 1741 / NCIMB 8310) TaxID=52561 RepID=A0A8G2F5E4_DESNO|nr:DUF2254 domain-containing protein [Desulfomicrobium norvegicum]SFM00254.1 Uncharacterized membrane protein [Desulfomicrobium norvegicum]
MWNHLSFIIKHFRERLWIKPLIVCVLSIAAVFLANLMDMTELGRFLPEITEESTETLLRIMASSMLMMATFAVASMVAAYSSASRSATPRSFPLIIADDVSQNALSVFIGAFIFSVVALVAMMNGLYVGRGSHFILFSLTIVVLAIVIVTFIRWVDNIARLGRLGHTITKVEAAAAEAIQKRQSAPRLGGVAAFGFPDAGRAVFGAIGYVQHVDIAALQARAVQSGLRIVVAALPGTFCTPGRPVAWVIREATDSVSDEDAKAVADTFVIGDSRIFDQDPRFGLVVLSEIASRALSPAVNDPGTAIGVTGTLVRLFAMWNERGKADDVYAVQFDRVAVPELSLADMFDDAFTGIARDGAGNVEVVVWLLKALGSLAVAGDATMRDNALRHARLAVIRAEKALKISEDITAVREAAKYAI